MFWPQIKSKYSRDWCYLNIFTEESFYYTKSTGIKLTTVLPRKKEKLWAFGKWLNNDVCNNWYINHSEKQAHQIQQPEQTWSEDHKKNSEPLSSLCVCVCVTFFKDCTAAAIVWAFGDCQTLIWLYEECLWGGFYCFQLENASHPTSTKPHAHQALPVFSCPEVIRKPESTTGNTHGVNLCLKWAHSLP